MSASKKKADDGQNEGAQASDQLADLQASLTALDPSLAIDAELTEDFQEAVSEEESRALLDGISATMAELDDSDFDSTPGPKMAAEPNKPTSGDAPLTDEEIAALISAAVDNPQPEPEPETEEEEELLSEDDLAELVRNMIAEQGAALDEAATSSEEALDATGEAVAVEETAADSMPAEEAFEPAGDAPLTDDEISALLAQAANLPAATSAAPTPVVEPETGADEASAAEETAAGVLSASQLAALLNAPDPEGDLVPQESAAMDPDELEKLVAEANEAPEPAPAAEPVQAASEPVVAPEPAAQPQPAAWSSSCDIGAVKAVPSHLAIRAMALPVRFHEGKLLCRVATPIDQNALDRLSKGTGFGIVVEPAPILEVVAGLREVYSETQDTHARFAVLDGAKPETGVLATILGLFKRSA